VAPADDESPRLLTKMSLLEAVAKAVDLRRHEAAHIVESIFDSTVRAIRSGDKVAIRGFGSFRNTPKTRANRSKSKDRATRGRTAQANSIFQT
jgi:nucleoid DNA-binding protein